ncbi:MAG: hypothetical protein ABI304_08945 [Rudaea sp.]
MGTILTLRHNPALSRGHAMKTQDRHVESELVQTFEPLRTLFAVLALVLGFIASAHM